MTRRTLLIHAAFIALWVAAMVQYVGTLRLATGPVGPFHIFTWLYETYGLVGIVVSVAWSIWLRISLGGV